MEQDVFLLMGLAFLPLAFVTLISAWADRRWPWAALILLVLGLAQLGYVVFTAPEGGLGWRDLPMAAVEALGRLWPR